MKKIKLLACAFICCCLVGVCGCTWFGNGTQGNENGDIASSIPSPETPSAGSEDGGGENVTPPAESNEDKAEEPTEPSTDETPEESGKDNTDEPTEPPVEEMPEENEENKTEEPTEPPIEETPEENEDENKTENAENPAETPPVESGESGVAPKLEISVASSAEFNTVTYGEDVCFSARAECSAEGYSFTYAWYHNGEIVCEKSELSLVKPSLSGGYDGVYTVKVVAKNGESEVSGECGIMLTVLPRRIQAEWADGDFVYTGEFQRPAVTVSGINGEIIGCSVTGGGRAAGVYSLTAEISSEDYLLENAGHTFEIKKATPELTLEVEDVVYGTEPSPALSGNAGGGKTVCSYGSIASPSRLPAGRNTYTVAVEETENYTAATATAEFTVLPLELTLTWSGCDNLTYDSKAKNITAHVGGALFPDVVYAEVINGNGVDAGGYVATATLKGLSAGNYVLPEEHTCKYTVEKSHVTILAGSNTSVYGEAIKPVTATVMGRIYNDEVTFTLNKEFGLDAGEYVVSVDYTATENYDVTVCNGIYLITKALPVIAGESGGKITLADVAVGTKPSELTSLMPAASVSGGWKWKSLTPVSFGANNYAVTFVPDDANYCEVDFTVIVCGKNSNSFTVNLMGINEVEQFTDCDTPYVLTFSDDGNYVWYTANCGDKDITQSVDIKVERVDGENTAEVDSDGCFVLLNETGTYLFTFALPATEELLSYAVTVTVKVVP